MASETVTLDNGQFVPAQGVDLTCDDQENIAILRQDKGDGVSPCRIIGEESDAKWYLMRAAYGQELKAVEYLQGQDGIDEVFCPQWMQERTFGGKRKKVLVSLLPNMLFVRSTNRVLRNFVGVPPLTFFHHYYQPYKDEQGRKVERGRKPMIIPDRQMEMFRRWYDAKVEDKIYLNDTFHFKKDDLVRVTEGDFEGFTGHVVRLKGQTRVGVNIDGVGFISTTYIPKHCLEKVEVEN